jgi:hypothetical protein
LDCSFAKLAPEVVGFVAAANSPTVVAALARNLSSGPVAARTRDRVFRAPLEFQQRPSQFVLVRGTIASARRSRPSDLIGAISVADPFLQYGFTTGWCNTTGVADSKRGIAFLLYKFIQFRFIFYSVKKHD